jgi:hypothetical protein
MADKVKKKGREPLPGAWWQKKLSIVRLEEPNHTETAVVHAETTWLDERIDSPGGRPVGDFAQPLAALRAGAPEQPRMSRGR